MDEDTERRAGMDELRKDILALQTEMRLLTESIQGVLEAWKASKWMLNVIKITAAIGASIAIMWSFIKTGRTGG